MKALDESKYKRAAIYLLMISNLANKLGKNNFYMIYQRYLKNYKNEDFLNEIFETLENDVFLKILETK